MRIRLLLPAVLASALLATVRAAAPEPPPARPAAAAKAAASEPVKPKAFLTGPASVKVNSWVWLDTTGSVGSAPVQVITLVAPPGSKVDPQLHYDRAAPDAMLLGAMLRVTTAGSYLFMAEADGDLVPPSTVQPRARAVWPVTVIPDEPGPTPTPTPGPGPTPPPVPPVPPVPPTPAPVPQTIKLIAVAVYSGDTTSAAEREFVAVRESLTLADQLATMNVSWNVMDRNDPRLGPKTAANPLGCNIGQYIAPVGPNPQMVIYDTGNTSNSMYDAAGARLGQKVPASFDVPKAQRSPIDRTQVISEAAIISMFKHIRGINP